MGENVRWRERGREKKRGRHGWMDEGRIRKRENDDGWRDGGGEAGRGGVTRGTEGWRGG